MEQAAKIVQVLVLANPLTINFTLSTPEISKTVCVRSVLTVISDPKLAHCPDACR